MENIKNISETESTFNSLYALYNNQPPSTFSKVATILENIESYSPVKDEDVMRAIYGTNVDQKAKVSNYYYGANSLYKSIVHYFSNYYFYYNKIEYHYETFDREDYDNGLTISEKLKIPVYSQLMMLDAIKDGVFYGVTVSDSSSNFAIVKIPREWCKIGGYDLNGLRNYYLDFRVIEQTSQRGGSSGSSIVDQIKETFPKPLYKAWKKYLNKKTEENRYALVTNDMGICLSITSDLYPMMLGIIKDIGAYDKTKDIEYLTAMDELKKIIVQKFPLGSDNEPVLTDVEIKEYHRLVVGMLKNNPYTDLITTIADIDKIQLQEAKSVQDSKIENAKNAIYDSGGMPHILFSPEGNVSLQMAISKTGAEIWPTINYLGIWFTYQLNMLYDVSFGQKKEDVFFEVNMLPVSHYNRDNYLKNVLQMSQNGFDYFLPAIALGQSQRQIESAIKLNRDLGLLAHMQPLKSSHTTANGESVEIEESKKADKTIVNEESGR